MSAAESIAPQLSGGETVILESTSHHAPPEARRQDHGAASRPLPGRGGWQPVVYFASARAHPPGRGAGGADSNDRIIGGSTLR
ncbi:hypothetical protein QJS66_03315 [Kocuria rhizophila]|nr:hypothetical protein QJS66_03315 [Kocuria rhizophila]